MNSPRASRAICHEKESNNAPRPLSHRLALPLLTVCLLTLCGSSLPGCGSETASLYEAEHVTPAHWPADLADAAEKIRERIALVNAEDREMAGTAERELIDLVKWTPEIAADTDMTESDWLPIYEQAERLRVQLSKSKVELAPLLPDIEALAGLLSERHQALEAVASKLRENYD
jgi:hypothetical protein